MNDLPLALGEEDETDVAAYVEREVEEGLGRENSQTCWTKGHW